MWEGRENGMKVTIKKMGINGEGIGYIDRMPVFVPGALCGEEVEITKPGSRVKVFVIPTDEEMVIARDTAALTAK